MIGTTFKMVYDPLPPKEPRWPGLFIQNDSWIEHDDCMHTNCPGCKDGTCSGIHMISCPCKKCTVQC